MLDLRRFQPRPPTPASSWEHAIRAVDREGRLALPEAGLLEGRGCLGGFLYAGRWELGRASHHSVPVAIDQRHRTVLPIGVRQQLGATSDVLVSVALDRSRLLIVPAALLDTFLEIYTKATLAEEASAVAALTGEAHPLAA